MGSNYFLENIFLAILGVSLLSSTLGTPGISHEEMLIGSWVPSNSSSKLQTKGNTFFCNKFCYALWEDCVSSGEHLWRIYFETEVLLQAVELTTKEKFAEELGFGDYYYERVEPGSTVEILASFSDGKLKGYFGYNNQSLGQIVELDASSFSTICPAIQYYGMGLVKVEKVTEIPPQSSRKDLRDFPEMEGNWYVLPENFRIGETNFSNFSTEFLNARKNLATLFIKKLPNATVGYYSVSVDVINNIQMEIRMHDDSWKSVTSAEGTLMGGPFELLRIESQMSKLIQNPDFVKIISGNLIVKKDDMVVTFVR